MFSNIHQNTDISNNENSESNFSILIDLQYSYYSLLLDDHTNCISNFWKASKKENVNRTFSFFYKNGNNMLKPELIKDYLIHQSHFISKLSLEDSCILISQLTSTSIFIKNYIQFLSSMSELIIVDNKKDNKQAEARHAITPIFVFKSLWFLLYSIFKEDDDLYNNIPITQDLCLDFFQTNENENLEFFVVEFTTKQLKLSQIRFLALEIERKLITNYLNKSNELLFQMNPSKYKIYLFQTISVDDSNNYFYFEDKTQYYLKYYFPFSLQQNCIYIPDTNIDDKPSQIINTSDKNKFMLFPDVKSIKDKIKITDRGIYSISSPKASQYTSNLILQFAKKNSVYISTIMDGTAGLGGNVYNFMTIFKNVIAVESDKTTYEALLNNCELYKNAYPEKYKATIYIFNKNIVSEIQPISQTFQIDAVFMSPPWGGVNYKNASNITYYLDNVPLWDVSKYFLEFTSLLYLDVGKNINMNEFLTNLNKGNPNKYIVSVIERTNYAFLICIFNKQKIIDIKSEAKKEAKKEDKKEDKNIINKIESDLTLQSIYTSTFDKNNKTTLIKESCEEVPIFIEKGCYSLCLDLLLPILKKNTITSTVNNIILPLSTVYKKVTTLNYKPFKYIVDIESMKPFPTKEQMFFEFSNYFESDLLGWKTNMKKPHWIVKGGFGIRQLLGHKYNETDISEVIKTKDIDLNVSIKDKMFREKYIQYIQDKCKSFFLTTNYYFLFQVHLILFPVPVYNKVERNNLFALLLIRYQNSDWIDIGFVDYYIKPDMIDWSVSYKVGFPIKTAEYYMEEIVKLVYQSNVPMVDSFTYKKRNPIKGSLFKKGIQDIDRSKILCELDSAIYEDYELYCEYVSTLKKEELYHNDINEINFDFLQKYFNRKMKQLERNVVPFKPPT